MCVFWGSSISHSTLSLQDSLAQYLVPTGIFPVVIFCEEQDTEIQFTDGDIGFM